jgi:hypothetical protein
MFRFFARISVVFLVGTGVLCAQQPVGTPPQMPAQKATVKRHPSRKAKAAPKPMTVDVINGTETRTQVFRPQESAGTRGRETATGTGKRGSAHKSKSESAVTRVEIFNGSTSYTKTFKQTEETGGGASQDMSRGATGKPVVVGVANGGTTSRNGKLQPVVTGVASSESKDGTGDKRPVVVGVASSGSDTGKPVVQSVQTGSATRSSKRRPYRGPSSRP